MARTSQARPSTLRLQDGFAAPPLERKSSSEPDLNTTSHHELWTSFGRGFPPGLTVDELAMYRRRRPPGDLPPHDNLRLHEGTLMFLKSEYRRRFVPHPPEEVARLRGRPDSLRLEGDVFLRPEYRDAFVDLPRERPRPRPPPPQLGVPREPLDAVSVHHSSYVFHEQAQRPRPQRRRTNLRCEGEQCVHQSEARERYAPLEGVRRAELARRKTSLRLDGEMDLTTEKKDKFVAFPGLGFCSPSSRRRAASSLRLEGAVEHLTEARSRYVGHGSPERPAPRRRPTSLHLEGELEKTTETLEKYVAHPRAQRPDPLRQPTSLRLEGDLDLLPEYRDLFVDFPRARPVVSKPADSLRQEGDFETTTEKRAQFVSFLLNHASRTEKFRRPGNLMIEGDYSFLPEYRDCFICFPCDRPQVKKQKDNIKQEGSMELVTEKQAKFGGHPDVHRPPLQKRNTNLKLGGDIFGASQGGKPSLSKTDPSDEVKPSCINESCARNQPITTQPYVVSAEIRPAYIPKFHDGRSARRPQALAHVGRQKKYHPPRTALRESERLLREMLEKERGDVGRRRTPAGGEDDVELLPRPPSPYGAFQVLDNRRRGATAARPDKSVTFDISDTDKRSSGADSTDNHREGSPTFRLLVQPADGSGSPRASPLRGLDPNEAPLAEAKSFLVLDDVNNNDVSGRGSDPNGNDRQGSARNSSAFLDVPRGGGRRDYVRWMPPWYAAPSSI